MHEYYVDQEGVFSINIKSTSMLTLATIPSTNIPVSSTIHKADNASSNTRLASGGVDGNIYIWNGNTCNYTISAHKDAINCLHYSSTYGLLSASKDGTINVWRVNVKNDYGLDNIMPLKGPKAPVIMGSILKSPEIRSICWSNDGKKILIGTICSDLVEIDSNAFINNNDAGGKEVCSLVSSGHAMTNICGLAINYMKGKEGEYATAGGDNMVRYYTYRASYINLTYLYSTKLIYLYAIIVYMCSYVSGILIVMLWFKRHLFVFHQLVEL